MVRRIAAVTGTRADYGLLLGTLKGLKADPGFELSLFVTGAHLEGRFGATWKNIVQDGFQIDEKIPLHLELDSPIAIAEAMGRGLPEFVSRFQQGNIDIVLLLGDRYETFLAAQAAMLCRLPIAHIHGGERTEGALDEAFRHAISKMAHVHFPTCEEHRRRLIQLGETPDKIFNVGAPGVDNIRKLKLATRQELEQVLELPLSAGFLLVTYHPVTLNDDEGVGALEEMLAALDDFSDLPVVITGVNADPGFSTIDARLHSYSTQRPTRVRHVSSLGSQRYLGAMKICSAVIGNSSSGIIEAPSLGIPSVNIGNRQLGRVRSRSTIDCNENRTEISDAIKQALSPEFRSMASLAESPYGRGGAAEKIITILKHVDLRNIIRKRFHDLPVDG